MKQCNACSKTFHLLLFQPSKQGDGKQTTADLTTSIYNNDINSSKNVVKYNIPQQNTFIHSLEVPLLTINLSHCQFEVVQASLIDRA